jgi:hypothetical protein
MYCAQSRQSARLFLQSSELGPPPPLPQASVSHPHLVPGKHSLAGEGVGWGRGHNSDEGTDCGTLGINVLCDIVFTI